MTKTTEQKRTGKGIGFALMSIALISAAALVASGDTSTTLRYLTFVTGIAGVIMNVVNS